MKTLSWFQWNIWKTIYRDHSCNCNDCVRIDKEWLTVYSKEHAKYLFDVQNDYASEGEMLNYRDLK